MTEDNSLEDLSQGKISMKLSPSPFALDNKLPEKSFAYRFTKSYPHKNGELLSRQYGLNIFILGLFMLFACSLNVPGVPKQSLLYYLVTLMLIQLIWMIWYIFKSYSQRKVKQHKDSHAGTWWLRCAILLFAGITLILDALKMGYFIGYIECESITEVVIFLVSHAVYAVLQAYFLWNHAKDVIQSFKTLERFGLIHSVFTNLLLWAAAVLIDSKHQLIEHKERLSTLGFENITLEDNFPACNCSINVCSLLSKGIYYLYPFNLEYHILASTMLYVLWKNIGSKETHHTHTKSFQFQGVWAGALLGMTVLATTIVVLIIYFIQMGSSKMKSESALIIYYLYSITVLSLMCVVEFVGLFLYQNTLRFQVEARSPAIKLDTELLVGSACGAWIMALGSILAIICAITHPVYTWYNLPYSVLVIIEKFIQNMFIVKFLYFSEEKISNDIRTTHEIFILSSVRTLSLVSPDEEMRNETDSTEERPVVSNGRNLINKDYKDDTKDHGYDSDRLPVTDVLNHATRSRAFNKKRVALKNIVAFLLLCNISLWIPPAFGCRPQYDNGQEELVFGFQPWIILIDIAMPFAIFYRMHSASSLFDIYCKI
uniref:Proton channel OTOP1-like n=1 Tax=Geotrypetes seraphini TaxID=260995 RepID=A0A6P8RKD7_GEOSA|nr:proton channel OTOP1-like [Geotrypetes seraphini]